MLTIFIDKQEFYDDKKGMFFYTNALKVKLEHSLISISKWESYWKKPFLPSYRQPGMSGYSEEVHYMKCMIIGTVPEYIPRVLWKDHGQEVKDYITDPFSATSIYRIDKPGSGKPGPTITSELIYYWMIKYSIPFECDRWHFNRLMMLLDVCNTKENTKGNKMSHADSVKYMHELNKQRLGL